MLRAPGERLLLLGALLLPIVLLANAFVTYTDLQQISETERRLVHGYQVLNTITELLGLVRDAETGQRGYIMTGEGQFLDPYRVALPQVGPIATRLDSLVADDEAQRRRVATLLGHAERRLQLLLYSTQVYDQEGFDAARSIIRVGAGQQEMEALRAVAGEIRAHEVDQLAERFEESAEAGRRAILTLILTTLLALAFLFGFMAVLHRLLKTRREAAESLERRRDELETLVRERTQALAAANEGLRAENAVRVRAESHLRAFTAELERSNRELEDFAFIASHDLQEPLRKIQVFGERLESRYAEALPEKGRQDLQRLTAAAGRMRRLVDDVLAYTRVGRRHEGYRSVDLNEVVADALSTVEGAVEQTRARVEVGPLPTVEGWPSQLHQLFQNLLTNALKFQREGGVPCVRVSAETEEGGEGGGGLARITVADNGIGFDEKYLDRIFSPFERLHADGRFAGTGIGLAVCRRIAEQHGGTIMGRSALGEGATFVVTLPLRQPSREPYPR